MKINNDLLNNHDNIPLCDTRKYIYKLPCHDLNLAIANKETVFLFNKPIFEEIEAYIFKFVGYENVRMSIEEAKRYSANLESTIKQLDVYSGYASAFEELGID